MDSSQVINHLVRSLGVAVHEATAFVEAVYEIVEEQVTDDVSVVAPPLIVGRFGDPVLDRMMMRLDDPRWRLPESLDISPKELGAELRLPVEVVESYPVVGRFGLLAKVIDRLSASDEDAEHYLRMLDTWLATYADGTGRDFEVVPTGSKDAFRGWLLDRFDMLGRYGYPGRVATIEDDELDGLHYSFDDGRRPDLVARITDNGDLVQRGDWLVVMHKVTAVGHNAQDELAASVDWLRAELGDRLDGAEVHGLLIADGASLLLERALRERGFGYLSLSVLGYRRWVRSHTRVAAVGEPDATSIAYPPTLRPGTLAPVAG